MKILALDIGDRWVGSAISDPLGILARPFQTIQINDLENYLSSIIQTEQIGAIIIGLPTTLRGTESEQTKKVKFLAEKLKKKFSSVNWILWDERLTSKQANRIKQAKTKEEKLHSHSIAAALILSSYLEYKRMHSALQ